MMSGYTVCYSRMLGARIAELEHRLKVLEISGLWSGSSGPVLDLTWNEDSDKERLDSKKGWCVNCL